MTTPGRPNVSDGLIPPLNAPKGRMLTPGIQAGVSNNIVLAQYVVVFGTTGGVFIYDGIPAAGNPPIYWTGNVTADPYGNALVQGTWAGQMGAIQVGMQADPVAGTASVFFVPSSAHALPGSMSMAESGTQSILQIFGVQTTDNPDSASDSVGMYLWDHGSSGLPGATSALQGIYFDSNTGNPQMFYSGDYNGLKVGGASVVAAEPGSYSPASPWVNETWHDITVDAGWGGLGEAPQYQLMAQAGFVALRGDISHAGTTAQVDINSANPLPVGYRPAATRYYRTPQAADGAGAIEVQSSGVITMRASGFSATQAILDGLYSL